MTMIYHSKKRCPGCNGQKKIPSIGFISMQECTLCKGKGEVSNEEEVNKEKIETELLIVSNENKIEETEIAHEIIEEKKEPTIKKKGRPSKYEK